MFDVRFGQSAATRNIWASVTDLDGFPMSHSQVAVAGITSAIAARALYSPRETEAILGISHASLYRLIGAGRLDARKLGGKTLITADSIERLVSEMPKVKRQGRRPDARSQ
jgi:hypothetical protein